MNDASGLFITIGNTAQKMKFSIKDSFSKCDQIHRKLRIWSHLLKESLIENFSFCAVQSNFEQILNDDNSVPIHRQNVQALAIEMQKIADCTAPKIIKEVLNYVKRAITIFETLHNLLFLALIQCT